MDKKDLALTGGALGVFALLMVFKEKLVCSFLGHAYPLRVMKATSWAWECPRCGFSSQDDVDFLVKVT